MPLTQFICPDGERIAVGDCLKEGGCRRGLRCASRAFLQACSIERKWKGKASTTQLIQGTMCSFLKLTKDYAISPESRCFMLLGTRAHKSLEDAAEDDECSLIETKLENGDWTGISDGIETENGISILNDHKTTGSYKVAKALGIYIDEEAVEGVFKSGPRKGQQRMAKVMRRDPSKIDNWDWELQLNRYRIDIKRQLGIDCQKIKIEAIVRDGNTQIARSRGIWKNLYYFDIRILPDNEVDEYFNRKKAALFKALEQGYWTDFCTDKENWDGIKCSRFCDVAEHCPYGIYLKEQKEKEDVNFMTIKGLYQPTKIPRLGKIRLGIKKTKKRDNGSTVEYPAEVDYFILDPETPIETEREKYLSAFRELYGDKPKIIDVMLPTSIPHINLQSDFKRYGGNNLVQCRGDGETAVCMQPEHAAGLKVIGKTEEGMTKVECLGENCPNFTCTPKKCGKVAVLNVLLPKLPGIGVWQIVTHSVITMGNIVDSMLMNLGLMKRIHMLPATLERREVVTNHDGKAMPHYPLFLDIKGNLEEIQRLAMGDPTTVLVALPAADPRDVTLASAVDCEALPSEVVDKETGEVTEVKSQEEKASPASANESPSPAAGIEPDEETKKLRKEMAEWIFEMNFKDKENSKAMLNQIAGVFTINDLYGIHLNTAHRKTKLKYDAWKKEHDKKIEDLWPD